MGAGNRLAVDLERMWGAPPSAEIVRVRQQMTNVYELDPATRAYALTGIHHDKLAVGVPYGIDIDLTGIADR